ncbi:MAG: branched-chain amino acid ABC transporter permease [Deltaproteobacteria bacterium]|jgi:branched-chain amino acid transport system permease protein|nr:branched-chain amino acid ABC transporter permease [Deltaproteobacteria bacterium]
MSLTSQIIQFFFTGLNVGSIYALVALGFTMIYNATAIINLAQGEFVMLGGLIMVFSTAVLQIPMFLGFFLTVMVVTTLGALFERLAIHPLKNASLITLIIITLAGSILFRGIAMLLWGRDPYGLPPFSGGKPIPIWGATLQPQFFWVLGITGLVLLGIWFFFNRTLAGKAMTACSFNAVAARLVGINVKKMVLLSFSLSASVGAIAGAIITPITLMEYDRGPLLALKGFAAAVLGGLGSGAGAIVAGFLIGILESLGAGLVSSGYKDALALFVLLIVLWIKPSGLFGSAEESELKKF